MNAVSVGITKSFEKTKTVGLVTANNASYLSFELCH